MTALLQNILNQPASLSVVRAHHLGPGRDALTRAAALLASAKRVIVSGMGASFFATAPFTYWLSSLGQCVLNVESSELLYFLDAQIDPETVVLLVSRSGESIEVIKLLRDAKNKGAKVIGLSNVPGSTLDTEADQSILFGSEPDQLVAIQTYTATLATFSLLQAAYTSQLDFAASALEETVNALTRCIPELVEDRETWSHFLDAKAPLYILGRGPSSGSVSEGVLLMHETAKASAVGMTVAQFRHGPVEVVDADFRALLIGTQPATLHLDAALAEDLAGMGGQIRWIGPPAPGSRVEPLCSWPAAVPQRFSSIAEITPLQIAAYRKAELNSIRPGDFRWAPAVTTSETGFDLSR